MRRLIYGQLPAAPRAEIDAQAFPYEQKSGPALPRHSQ